MKFINPQFAFILLILNIFTSQNAWSQKDFRPASLYGLKGDTITGWIDYRNWERNPHEVRFCETSSLQDVQILSPMDILGFSVQKEKYISAIVQAEVSPIQLNHLQGFPDFSFKTDTVFLRSIYEGGKSLYLLTNENGRENLFISQPTGLELLLYKKYLRVQNGVSEVAENNRYIGQLILYLEDCPRLSGHLATLKYNPSSIGTAFREYYKCRSIAPAYQFKREKVKLECGALAGVSYSRISVNSPSHKDLNEADYTPCVDYNAGLYFDLIRPRSQNKWSLCTEMLYTRFHTTGTYTEYDNPQYYSITTLDLSKYQLKLNILMRYRYLLNKSVIYGNIGFSDGLTIESVNRKTRYMKLYSDERTEVSLAIPYTRLTEQALLIGTGIRYKRLSFELRFELGNGFSDNISIGTTMSRLYGLAGFRF